MRLSRRTGRHAPALWSTPIAEPVTLADGPADQVLIPGVAVVPATVRQLAHEQARRDGRRGSAALPCGGLWDETSQNQQELF